MLRKHNIKVTHKVLRLFDKKSEAQTIKHLLTRTAPLLVSFLIACYVAHDKVDIIYCGAKLLISIPMAFVSPKPRLKRLFLKWLSKVLGLGN